MKIGQFVGIMTLKLSKFGETRKADAPDEEHDFNEWLAELVDWGEE